MEPLHDIRDALILSHESQNFCPSIKYKKDSDCKHTRTLRKFNMELKSQVRRMRYERRAIEMLGRGNDKVPAVRRPWGGRTR